MKKILSFVSLCFLALTSLLVLVACGDKVKAEDILKTLIVQEAGTNVSEDFSVASQITRGETVYPLTWESNNACLSVATEADENNTYLVSVKRPEDAQTTVTLKVTLEISKKNTATREFTFNVSPYDVYDFSGEFTFEKSGRNVTGKIDLPTSYTLEGTNQTCEISWTSSNEEYVSIAADGKSAEAVLSFVKVPVKLNATFKYKNETTTKSYTVNVLEQVNYEGVTTLEENVAYKFGFLQVTLENTYYWFSGEMSGYYGATTNKLDEATDVYVEKAGDKYHLYFTDAEGKKYINTVVSGTYVNYSIGAEATTDWEWNTEYNTFTTPALNDTYYMGTYSSYSTFSCSKISYAATSFVGQMYKADDLANATPTYTADQKVSAEKVLVSIDDQYPGTIELDATGSKFDDVTITYAVKGETTAITIEENKLTCGVVTEDTKVVVTATFTCGTATATKDIEFTVKSVSSLKVSAIEDVLDSDDGTIAKIQGLVLATSSRGYIVYDGEDAIYVYAYKTADGSFAHVVGDYVEVIGTRSYYNGDQLSPVVASTKATGLSITAPTAAAYTATELAAFLAADDYDTVLVTYTGTLSVSGSYFNVAIEGLTGEGSLSYVTGALKDQATALNGKTVKITGVLIGISKKSGSAYYANTVLTAIEEVTA